MRARPLLLSLAVLAGCDGGTDPVPIPGSLQLSHATASFDAIGDSLKVMAEVRDQFGEPLEGTSVEWATSASSVATVSGSGVIRATGPGTASIQVTAGDAGASIAVQVDQVPSSAEFVSDPPAEAPAGSMIDGPGVRVLDANRHPILGAGVEFTVTSGTIDSGDSAHLTTGPDGVAEFSWVVSEVSGGTARLVASPTGLAELDFTVEIVPATPAELRVVSGDGQSGHRLEELPAPYVLRLLDAFENAIPGESIEIETPAGSGEIDAASTVTDTEGEVELTWTLGSELGPRTAQVRAGGIEQEIHAEAFATPGAIVIVSGDGQTAHRTLALADPVVVRVLDVVGEPIAGLAVDTEVSGQGGTVVVPANTDAAGEASLLWTLGEGLGSVQLWISAGPVSAVVEAEAFAVPDTLVLEEGDDQSAPAGDAVPDPLRVRVVDQAGLGAPGVAVTFAVAGGGGAVSGETSATVDSDSSGIASAHWVLGTESEAQTVTATASGLPVVTFTATADLTAPAALTVVAGTGQHADPGDPLPVPVVVRLEDLAGDPVPDVAVIWSAEADGSVTAADTATDAQGEAVATWVLGTSTGTQTLTVNSAGLTATVQAQANDPGTPTTGYHIEYDFQTSIDPDVRQVFEDAAARWSQVITGKLPEGEISLTQGRCGSRYAIDQTVDDILILVQIEPIDGPGGILGSAGPCLIRSTNSLTIVGRVRLDEADVANMLATGRLFDVVLHEVGHVLGIGTLWGSLGLLQDRASVSSSDLDPYFSGIEAIAGFDAVGGTGYTLGNKVPVENTGGSGTRNRHWRQSVLSNELMTGWLTGGGSNPLSVITIGSLMDMGYAVDLGAADAFGFSPLILGGLHPESLRLKDDVDRFPIDVVGPDGEIVRTLPPLPDDFH